MKAISTVFASQIGSQESEDYQIESWKIKYCFHNQGNNEVYLHLYEVVARGNIPALTGSDPSTAIARGLANQPQGTGSTTMTTSIFGATPFMSAPFTSLYKVVKQRKFVIPLGGKVDYTMHGRRNKTIHLQRYYNATTSTLQLYGEQGYYKNLYYRIYGAPCNDVTTTTSVAPSLCALDVIENEVIQVGYNTYQNYKKYYSGSGFAAVATPTVMNEASGAGSTVVTV